MLKVFAFDVDVYVVQAIAPNQQWLLHWRDDRRSQRAH
jgi:hypothetical protein